jgi:hypothetical protein
LHDSEQLGLELDRQLAHLIISLTTPGIGFVWCDGEPEPSRVRASWVSDNDIAAMVAAYTPIHPEDDGQAVIDLTDQAERLS